MLKYILLFAALLAFGAAMDDDAHAKVMMEFKKEDGQGHFAYGYDVSNGIGATEEGDQKDVHGEYHYVTSDGVVVKVTYTADKDGYHPQSDLLPTAPPMPEAIRKSLEYIKSHPSHEQKDNSQKHDSTHAPHHNTDKKNKH